MARFINHAMLEGAKNYALADKSDPFAHKRALTHLSNGIASYANAKGEAAFYNAEPYEETRYLPAEGSNGQPRPYQVTVYRNRIRP